MRIADSFSYLCIYLRKHNFKDTPDTIYFFGCMKPHADLYLNGGCEVWDEPLTPEVREAAKAIITEAEGQGRVFWRTHINPSSFPEEKRFRALLQLLVEKGCCPPGFDPETVSIGDAFWNIPAMRNFFSVHGINVEFAFRI